MKVYKIIFETVGGSHLYGTNIETSDMDYRGVALEPIESLIGLHPFEQHKQDEPDRVIYGLRKFVQLALDNNPNIVELFYAPLETPTCVVFDPAWFLLHGIREKFLSRKIAKTFVGYAIAQAKRMQTHHKWMTGEPPVKPDPLEYGQYVNADGTQKWASQDLFQSYQSHLKVYQQYQTWLQNRNPARHELEEKWGYDTKNGMHLIRLLEEGIELLKTGYLKLPRPNAKELINVRNGSVYYETLLTWMEDQIDVIDRLAERSVLPEKPDFNYIHEVVMRMNYNQLKNTYGLAYE